MKHVLSTHGIPKTLRRNSLKTAARPVARPSRVDMQLPAQIPAPTNRDHTTQSACGHVAVWPEVRGRSLGGVSGDWSTLSFGEHMGVVGPQSRPASPARVPGELPRKHQHSCGWSMMEPRAHGGHTPSH